MGVGLKGIPLEMLEIILSNRKDVIKHMHIHYDCRVRTPMLWETRDTHL